MVQPLVDIVLKCFCASGIGARLELLWFSPWWTLSSNVYAVCMTELELFWFQSLVQILLNRAGFVAGLELLWFSLCWKLPLTLPPLRLGQLELLWFSPWWTFFSNLLLLVF